MLGTRLHPDAGADGGEDAGEVAVLRGEGPVSEAIRGPSLARGDLGRREAAVSHGGRWLALKGIQLLSMTGGQGGGGSARGQPLKQSLQLPAGRVQDVLVG